MLIEIKKIKDTRFRDDKGNNFRNPVGNGEDLFQELILDEIIDVWAIKSIRPFYRNGGKHEKIEGDISVVYLYGKKDVSEIHIQANYKEFKEEVNELRRIGVRPA